MKKKIYSPCFLILVGLLILFFNTIAFAINDPCWQNPKFIEPIVGADINKFLNTLPKQAREYIISNNSHSGPIFETDISNSGNPEKIFQFRKSFKVMQQLRGKFKYLGNLSFPPNTRGLFIGLVDDNGNQQSLTELCGKTYCLFLS